MSRKAVRELHQPTGSNVPAMLVNLAGVAVGLASLASGWPTTHPLWIVLLIGGLAYFQHTWTTIFHEDAHYLLYRARWHNIFNGTIVGTLLMVPFTVYRHVHIRHHSKMSSPDDWELWPYCDPGKSLRFRRIFLLFDVLLGGWVAPFIYGRIFFVKHSPLIDPRLRRRIVLEYLLIAGFWGGVIALVAFSGAWWLFAKVYLIPAWLTGVIQTTRKLTEHLGLPAGDPMLGARTVLSESALGKAMEYTSFHISAHGLHHRHPQMPHSNLERAFELTTEEERRAPIFPSYWHAMRDMFSHLPHPGIGVNARMGVDSGAS